MKGMNAHELNSMTILFGPKPLAAWQWFPNRSRRLKPAATVRKSLFLLECETASGREQSRHLAQRLPPGVGQRPLQHANHRDPVPRQPAVHVLEDADQGVEHLELHRPEMLAPQQHGIEK